MNNNEMFDAVKQDLIAVGCAPEGEERVFGAPDFMHLVHILKAQYEALPPSERAYMAVVKIQWMAEAQAKVIGVNFGLGGRLGVAADSEG